MILRHTPVKQTLLLRRDFKKAKWAFPCLSHHACCAGAGRNTALTSLESDDRRIDSNVPYPLGKRYCCYDARKVLSSIKGKTDMSGI